MRDAAPTRRTVLAGLGAFAALGLGATACTSDDSGPTPEQRKADDDIRERARTASAALLDRYDAVIAAHAGLDARLRPYANEIGQHLSALGGTRTPASGVTPAGEPVPTDPQAAVADLAVREQQGADGRLADVPAASAELARLISSVSACQFVHAQLLGGSS